MSTPSPTPSPTPTPTPNLTLVTDLIFDARAEFDQAALLVALTSAYGSEEALGTKQMVDADMLDPRQEMQISPSMPFRRRGERRLMLLDEGIPAPPGLETQGDGPIKVDLRAAREALTKLCTEMPVRLGRIFILGAWGDAVLIARSGIDLRAIALLPWVLDPQVDIDGKRRAGRLSQQEFETKVGAYEKRLDELDEASILARISGATFTRTRIKTGDDAGPGAELLIVDNLEEDGSWDPGKSMVTAGQLAAIDRFSMIPGAPSRPSPPAAGALASPVATAKPSPAPAPKAAEPPPAPKGAALRTTEIDSHLVLVFPEGRFDLDVAAALGKRDWDAVVRGGEVTGAQRDRMQQRGADWVAPLEFLSEVFVEGKPLSKGAFESTASALVDGFRSLDVHFPRFGPVTLLDVPGTGRFVTSMPAHHAEVVKLVRA